MIFLNDILIFLIILKRNKNYSYYFKETTFPCLINNSNNSNNLIFKFIKNKQLIAVKYILKLIKNNKLDKKLFSENKFSNFNTLLDLFVCK